MVAKAFSFVIYGSVLISVLVAYAWHDQVLNNFKPHFFQKAVDWMKYMVRGKDVKSHVPNSNPVDLPVSFPILVVEIIALNLIVSILKKIKTSHGRDKIDELLMESREAMRETNEFLEKWRLRRINYQNYVRSYLDDEPQDIKPLKLEVPILHMAIIDTLGTTRSTLERGDAGDASNIMDSSVLSMTSLFDDELESIAEPIVHELDKSESRDAGDRNIWGVIEDVGN